MISVGNHETTADVQHVHLERGIGVNHGSVGESGFRTDFIVAHLLHLSRLYARNGEHAESPDGVVIAPAHEGHEFPLLLARGCCSADASGIVFGRERDRAQCQDWSRRQDRGQPESVMHGVESDYRTAVGVTAGLPAASPG